MALPENFEWDEGKAEINLRKHGVAFPTAVRVFQDPHALERSDDREDYGEERWTAIGDVGGPLVAVAHTYREDGSVIRIISARYADRRDQLDYYTRFGG